MLLSVLAFGVIQPPLSPWLHPLSCFDPSAVTQEKLSEFDIPDKEAPKLLLERVEEAKRMASMRMHEQSMEKDSKKKGNKGFGGPGQSRRGKGKRK